MPIDHTSRSIFVHVPKAGGTSMERMLGIWTYDNVTEEHPLRLFGRQLQHRTAQEMRDHFIHARVFEKYFKFAFVRNPWDRLLSEYHYLLERKVINFSFDEFASEGFLRRTDLPDFIYDHLRPQCDYIFDTQGNNLLDFIGRFEQMAEDWAKVAERLGLPKALPHLNKKKAQRQSYQSFYNDATRQSVANFYALDIQTFNYSF